MAFCNKCGTQMNEGAKFCAKCGDPVAQNLPPQAPPQQQQASANTATPQDAYQNASGGQVSSQMQTPPTVKKLIRAAAVCVYAVMLIIFVTNILYNFRYLGWTVADLDPDIIAILCILLVMAIPIILSFIGEKKKKRGLVLAAAIVYILMTCGIPSGILCILAFRKMPRKAK